MIVAAVEGGGTTFVVATARLEDVATGKLLERAEFPTTTPAATIGKCVEWLRTREYAALGVACFGPVDLQPASPTYGFITTTPKPGWQNVDVLGPLRAVRPKVPFGFDTDVNAPAVAEFARAVAEAKRLHLPPPTSCAYVTVGTGIGVGLVVNGAPVHGLMHPEAGHVCVPRRASDASFEGPNSKDTFGGLCAENMACSGALAKRASLRNTAALAALPDDDPTWEAAAHYLGALCANVVLVASPEKIVLSGGVMQRASLFPRVRARMQALLNGYLSLPSITTDDGVAKYVCPSTWGNAAGMVGALTLATRALDAAPAAAATTAATSSSSNGAGGGDARRGVLLVVAAMMALVALKIKS